MNSTVLTTAFGEKNRKGKKKAKTHHSLMKNFVTHFLDDLIKTIDGKPKY